MSLTQSEKASALSELYEPDEAAVTSAETQVESWWAKPETDGDELPPAGPPVDQVEQRVDLVKQQQDDLEAGITRNPGEFSPRYYKPQTRTVRGIDLATGKRELSRGDESNPVIEDDTQAGVELLRQSNMSVYDGPDDTGLKGMARVARATLREGGDYNDVKRYLSQYGAADDRVHTAINIAQEAMYQEDLSTGYSAPFTDEEIAATRDDVTEYDEQSLLLEEPWIEASKGIWEAENNAKWEGTREDLWQYGLETMSKFSNNIAGMPGLHPESMAYYTTQAVSRGAFDDNQYAKSLYTLLDMYDRTDISLNSVGRGAKAMMPQNDPVGWLAGGALIRSARRAGLNRMKKMLKESTLLGGVEGGLFLTADELARQVVAKEAGAQDEVDAGSVAMMGAAGVAAGAGLSKILDFAASPQMVEKYKKWGKTLMDNFNQDNNFVPMRVKKAEK